MANNSILTGATGEFYVAAYLSALGMVVGLPRAGVPSTDIFATSADGGKAIRIQVKTGRTALKGNKYRWRMKKGESKNDPSIWYAFVNLPDQWPQAVNEANGVPEVLFVPSGVVASVQNVPAEKKSANFWMWKKEAEKYKGFSGAEKLRKEIKKTR